MGGTTTFCTEVEQEPVLGSHHIVRINHRSKMHCCRYAGRFGTMICQRGNIGEHRSRYSFPRSSCPRLLLRAQEDNYLHMRFTWEPERGVATAWTSFPQELHHTLDHCAEPQARTLTLAALYDRLLAELHADAAHRFFAQATPALLQAQGVSLPWSTGIGAALLLPSAGHIQVTNDKIYLFGVPFDAPEIASGTLVDVRYDPDDARHSYLIHHGARVTVAHASAFEGVRVPWYELVAEPNRLNAALV